LVGGRSLFAVGALLRLLPGDWLVRRRGGPAVIGACPPVENSWSRFGMDRVKGNAGGGFWSSDQQALVDSPHVMGSLNISPWLCFVFPGTRLGGGCRRQSSAWKRGAFHGQMGAM